MLPDRLCSCLTQQKTSINTLSKHSRAALQLDEKDGTTPYPGYTQDDCRALAYNLCEREHNKGGTLVVVILPCRSTSVVKLLTRAFLWSAGLPSLATLFWCLMAKTLLPFCGRATILQCEHPTQYRVCW